MLVAVLVYGRRQVRCDIFYVLLSCIFYNKSYSDGFAHSPSLQIDILMGLRERYLRDAKSSRDFAMDEGT